MLDYLPILYLVALSLLIYRVAKSEKIKELLPLVLLSVFGIIIASFQGADPILFLSILIVFNLVAFSYGSKEGFFLVLFGIIYLFLGSLNFSVTIVAQAILFGLISEFWQIKFNSKSQSNKKVETNRDIVQIIIGGIILILFYSLKISYAEFSILMLIMLGYLTVNYGAANPATKLAKQMKKLERNFTKFGQGAAWLAMGSLAAMSFVPDKRYVVIIFFAIFIGDALATIIGLRFGKIKLPYNKKKSVAGSIAYFISVSAIPYFLYGPFAILLAVVATIAETLPIKLDDNFSVPAALILVYLIAEVLLF
ncbi:MAG: hypothetical protein KGH71_04260 [Candidatus Micrarchaeota archaeon]|nr:hypothetical protein [Candidatus Micrarchaeota archaeon]